MRTGAIICSVMSLVLGLPYASTQPAVAQNYPDRTIRIVVPYPAGGSVDVQARIIANHLSEKFKNQVVVENRPGATGVIGSQEVARSAADGYTLIIGTGASHAIAYVMGQTQYEPLTDFTPVVLTTMIPNAIFVKGDFPARTVPELVQYLKKNPGANYATSGAAASGRFAMELFQQEFGVQMNLVPYKGASPAVTDVLGGHIPLGITDIGSVTSLAEDKQLRLIAVTSEKRIPRFENVPTIAESTNSGKFHADAWIAIFAPAKTPPEIVKKLNEAITEILNMPDVRKRIEDTGTIVSPGPPEELGDLLKREIDLWGPIVRAKGIK